MIHQGKNKSKEGNTEDDHMGSKVQIGNLKKVYVALLLTEPFVVVFLILFLGTLLQVDPCLCSLLIHALNKNSALEISKYLY